MTTPSSSSSSLPLASAASALLHRLTAPLRRPRTRNIADFHIQPLEPHRQYAPGDVVQGAVVLTVVRPIRVTHLTICLHGLVRVYKSPAAAKDPFPLQDTVNGVRKSRYLGNGHACLFQDESALCGEGRLEPGLYRFNFELDFPAHGLPTSIDVGSPMATANAQIS